MTEASTRRSDAGVWRFRDRPTRVSVVGSVLKRARTMALAEGELHDAERRLLVKPRATATPTRFKQA